MTLCLFKAIKFIFLIAPSFFSAVVLFKVLNLLIVVHLLLRTHVQTKFHLTLFTPSVQKFYFFYFSLFQRFFRLAKLHLVVSILCEVLPSGFNYYHFSFLRPHLSA